MKAQGDRDDIEGIGDWKVGCDYSSWRGRRAAAALFGYGGDPGGGGHIGEVCADGGSHGASDPWV